MSSKPIMQQKPGKHRLIMGIMLAIVLLGGAVSFLMSGGKSTRKAPKREEVLTITLPPPPPPPLPPPPPPPPKNEPPPPEDEEMVEQAPVDEEVPPDAPPEAPSEEALGTNVQGNGPDMGLTRGGGGGTGNKVGSGRRAGKWDSYAVAVQRTISDALRGNQGTRSAAFSLTVRVWADEGGRITRAQLVGTSGNSSVDQAIKSQVLVGLQLTEPPPTGMPMPINMRITARKPI